MTQHPRSPRLVAAGTVAAALILVTATVAAMAAIDRPAKQAKADAHWPHHPSTHRPWPSWTPMPTASATASPSGATQTPTSLPTSSAPTTELTSVPTSSATSATSGPTSGTPVVFARHVAQWNVLCSADHFAPNDPIVFPGQPGRSHMHTFYGNTSTDADSTISSLSAASPSSCGRGMGTSDLSAYWVPSLMKKNPDGTSSVVKTDQLTTVYYRRAGGGMGPAVHPFPIGLRMIAGNAMATSDQSLSIVQWDCGGGGLESPHMYACPGGDSQPIHASLVFPSCWDGVHLDSPDHKSHMAYAAPDGRCPADHPVSLPEVTFEVDFPGIAGGPDYYLASGGIYSFHGDFIADWDNQVQNALVASCLNIPHECGDMNRDGHWLFRPTYDPEPIRIDLDGFPDTSPYDYQRLQGPVTTAPSATMSMP
jgi:hypothetical protein